MGALLAPPLNEFTERDLIYHLMGVRDETVVLDDNFFAKSVQESENVRIDGPSRVYQPLMNASALAQIRKKGIMPQQNIQLTGPFEIPPQSTEAKGRKRTKTPEAREQARSEQQKMASKRYRQKKKQVVENLEAKMEELAAEKARLENERLSTLDMVVKLQRENEDLKRAHQLESAQIEKDRLLVLDQLEICYKNNSPDSDLLPLLAKLHEYCKQISSIGECHAHLLLSPTVVSHLAKNGFFESPEAEVAMESDTWGLANLRKRLFEFVPSITDDQKIQLQATVTQHYQELDELRLERLQLNADISSFFSENPNFQAKAESPTDMPKMIQTMSTLEYLRQNLSDEIAKCESAIASCVAILTPRQRAQFYLELETQHKSVLQLKTLWDAMKRSMGK